MQSTDNSRRVTLGEVASLQKPSRYSPQTTHSCMDSAKEALSKQLASGQSQTGAEVSVPSTKDPIPVRGLVSVP